MTPDNDVLNKIDNILSIIESDIVNLANQIDYVRNNFPDPKPYQKEKQDILEQRLNDQILTHESLKNSFNELFAYLVSNHNRLCKAIEEKNAAILHLDHIALVNKDVLIWKKKADFYLASNKILFSQLQKERVLNGQTDKEPG